MIPQKMSKDMWQELKDYIRTTLGPPEGNMACRQILKEMEAAEKRWGSLACGKRFMSRTKSEQKLVDIQKCPEIKK